MSAPIIIHRPSPTGGRRVAVVSGSPDSFEDQDVVEFVRRA
ncbi:hypothetical protein ACFWVP_09630 [Streptomyces sp. NPDC058637]